MMHSTQATGGPCTMSGEAQRRPEWDLTHGGRVYRVTAEAGTVCTHAQASEAVYLSHQRGGDRMYFQGGLTLRVQRLDDYPMVPPAVRTPFDLRAAVTDSKANAAHTMLGDIIAAKIASGEVRDDWYIGQDRGAEAVRVEGVASVPFTSAQAEEAVRKWNGFAGATVRLSDCLLVRVSLVTGRMSARDAVNNANRFAPDDPMALYDAMRRMTDGPRLRSLLDQAESYHDQMATDLAVAQAKLALVERAVKQLRVALGEVVPINHGEGQ